MAHKDTDGGSWWKPWAKKPPPQGQPSEEIARMERQRRLPPHESKIVKCGSLEIVVDPLDDLSLLSQKQKGQIVDEIAQILQASPQLEGKSQQAVADRVIRIIMSRLNANRLGWTSTTLDTDLSIGEELPSSGEVQLDKIYQVTLNMNIMAQEKTKVVKKTMVLTIMQHPSGYSLLLKPPGNTSISDTVIEYGA